MPSLSLVTLLLPYALYASALPLSLMSALANSAVHGPSSMVSDMSPITLSLARRFNSTGSPNVLKFDQARAKALRQRAQTTEDEDSTEDGSHGNIINDGATSQVVSYVVTALIGTPPQEYQMLVDTGSSNTWVGAGKSFMPTYSTIPTGQIFWVTYGSGEVMGAEVLDTITLADGLTITNQSIGVATRAVGFEGFDGILGIGPRDLTCGSYLLEGDKCTATVTENAWNTGLLDSYEMGISFTPSSQIDKKNGQLTFGGVDKSKYNAPIYWTPLTTTSPANKFVGIDQAITYGNETILHPTAGILDTGTTLILLATDAFKRYMTSTGGVPDKDIGLLRITPEQYKNLKSLYFHIGGVKYELTPNAQIWPRALNAALGGTSEYLYLIVNDFGSPTGKGLDFINGMSFLERFYMVYDIGNNRAGLAMTKHTYDETN